MTDLPDSQAMTVAAIPDLFTYAASQPRSTASRTPVLRRPAELELPARPAPWERLLASAATTDITIEVSRLWTGVILEALSDPVLGRHMLHRDGRILPGAPYPVHGRDVFASVEDALRLEWQVGLVLVGTPLGSTARFRVRRPGEQSRRPIVDVLAALHPRPQEAPQPAGALVQRYG